MKQTIKGSRNRNRGHWNPLPLDIRFIPICRLLASPPPSLPSHVGRPAQWMQAIGYDLICGVTAAGPPRIFTVFRYGWGQRIFLRIYQILQRPSMGSEHDAKIRGSNPCTCDSMTSDTLTCRPNTLLFDIVTNVFPDPQSPASIHDRAAVNMGSGGPSYRQIFYTTYLRRFFDCIFYPYVGNIVRLS